MQSSLETRIVRLETMLKWVQDRIRSLTGRVDSLDNTTRQSSGMQYNWQGGGGTGSVTIGKTSTSIAARSGTTVTGGTVEIWTMSGGTLTDAMTSVTAYNFSAATGGIASGIYVSLAQDSAGNWWIISAECY